MTTHADFEDLGARFSQNGPQQGEAPRRPPVELFSVAELVAQHPNLHPPVIDGLIREGETMNIVSLSKFGKTWLVYGLAFCIVTGRWWFDFACSPGSVLIIDNELHKPTIASRLKTVAKAMGIDLASLVHSLDVISLRGNHRDINEIEEQIKKIKPRHYKAFFIDAKYRMNPIDVSENDNAAETRFYNKLDYYAELTQAAGIVVHHASKGDQSGKRVTDVGAGAGAQSRAADCHLVLREHEQDDVAVLDAVVRSFPPVEPLPLRWDFPLWTRAEGIDPSKLKSRSGSDQRQKDRDREGCEKILERLKTSAATRRQLRTDCHLSPDRLERLLKILLEEKKITKQMTFVVGNEAEVFRLVSE